MSFNANIVKESEFPGGAASKNVRWKTNNQSFTYDGMLFPIVALIPFQ